MVDDFGNKFNIGDQQDIVEYFLNFLDRLQEGILEVKKDGKIGEVSLLSIYDESVNQIDNNSVSLERS